MAQLFRFQSCDGHRLATRRGYLKKRASTFGNEQSGSVPIQSASQSPSGVGQYLRRTAHDIDAFQFALRKEPYRRAVGRPEGIVRSVRSRQRLCGKRIQRPNPELIPSPYVLSQLNRPCPTLVESALRESAINGLSIANATRVS